MDTEKETENPCLMEEAIRHIREGRAWDALMCIQQAYHYSSRVRNAASDALVHVRKPW